MEPIFTEALASIGRRILAKILDFMVLIVPGVCLNWLIPGVGGFIALFLYYPFFESSILMATPGKYWVGIQVRNLDGTRVSFRTAVIRHLLSYISSFFLIGYFFALFTEKKQTLHDLLASTLVVYGRDENSFVESWLSNFKVITR